MADPTTYFALSETDKIDALETAASKLGRPSDLLEKDIWVVWALNILFDGALAESLVFKGGTSLSKVYKAIDRFSEDIDVTCDIRKIIPDLIDDPTRPYPPNRSQAKKWAVAIQGRLSKWIAKEVVPILENKIQKDDVGARLRLDNDQLYLDYPALRGGTGYVRPTVLLEFGARSTGEPAERHHVICDLADAIDGLVFPVAQPRVMKAERTFWEKAMAIHAYCLRGTFRGGDRYARHWYDLERLDQTGIARRAYDDRPLAHAVAEHKQHFFRDTDAAGSVIDYQTAVDGSLCLVPAGAPLDALKDDYYRMIEAGLFQSDVVSFDNLMTRLAELQDRLNTGGN